MRLIDADALQTSIALYAAENAYINDTPLDVLEMVSKWLDEAPTIAAEPVRHGTRKLHADGTGTCMECRSRQKHVWGLRQLAALLRLLRRENERRWGL